jgi:predicted ATPase
VDQSVIVCNIEALTNQDLSEADYITLSQYLLNNNLRIEVIIRKKFSPADILGSARRFVKLIEVLYDKNVSVVIICSEFTPTSVFDEIYRVEKLIETGSIGAGPHSLASPLSLPAVSEAILSIARCRSRLEQCVASDTY